MPNQVSGLEPKALQQADGTLTIDSASIGASLLMRASAASREVTVRATRIAGQLNLISARVDGMLNIDTTHIGTTLLMSGGAKISDVLVMSNKIAKRLDLSNIKNGGVLTEQSTIVEGELLMNDACFSKKVNLVFVQVETLLTFEAQLLPRSD
jgi:hypothetical protein